jgi:hypothetical protein
MVNPKIGESYNTINPLRNLETIYSWLAKKIKNNRLEIFFNKIRLSIHMFTVCYQNLPKRVFIFIFFALMDCILGLATVSTFTPLLKRKLLILDLVILGPLMEAS